MATKITRRTLVAGAAAAGTLAAAKRSAAFAAPAPAVLRQSGPVEITYWGSWSGSLGEAEQEVVAGFNASQSDVKVNYQYQGSYEETAQKLTAALAAKQAPDISALSDVWWFKFYVNGMLAPLNDLFAANEVDTADYVQSLFTEGVREETSFWVPFARSTPLFYYNRDAFREIGLEAPPATWSGFAEIAPQLVKKDGDTVTRSALAYSNGASYIAWLFQGMTWAFGGAYSDPDFTIRIAEPKAVAAGEFVRTSIQDGWATITQDPENGPESDFYTGFAATTLASTGSMRQIQETAEFEVGAAFLPEEEFFGCCTGGAGLAIMAGSPPEKQEAAFKYLAFATSPEVTARWSQNTGYMPVRTSAVESPEMQEFFAANPNFKVAVDQLPQTRPQDSARVWIPGGDQIIGKGLEQIIVNDVPAQEAFDVVAATLAEEAKPVIEAIAAMG